jgi:predicted metal-dependent phosphoesterase TrpH
MSVDLHTHSTASDGSVRPGDLPRELAAHDIKIGALTDHDTIGGLDEFFAACDKEGIVAISGIEYSTVHRGTEVHLLGYGLPRDNPKFQSFMKGHAEYLHKRAEMTLAKLREYGLDASIDDVYKASNGNPPMPPHVLMALAMKGYIHNLGEAVKLFNEYLIFGGKAWVDHTTQLEGPLNMLVDVRAIAIVGHPTRLPDLAFLGEILDMGAHGFELYYPDHTGKVFDELEAFAKKRDCMVTGGSDYHGAFAERIIGVPEVPLWVGLKLMEAIGQEIPAALAAEGGGVR